MKAQIHGQSADFEVRVDMDLDLRVIFPSKRFIVTTFCPYKPLTLDTNCNTSPFTSIMVVEGDTSMYDPDDKQFECEGIRTKILITNDTISLEMIGTPKWGSFIPEVAASPKLLIEVGQDLAAMIKNEILYEWHEQAWE